MKKTPIWTLLLERGVFEDRKTAERWIMAGKVTSNGVRIDKPGQPVPFTDAIVVKGLDQRYVSKGGLKLEGALSDFAMDVQGVVAVDAGASTGGFTDCLLRHGAARVYAVDVGYGRLVGKLRADPRVVVMEKVNVSDPALEKLDPRPALATVDLSYLSLKTAIPIFANILKQQGDLVCLVKPMFEVHDSEICRSGKIDDPGVYREVLKDLSGFVDELGFAVTGITHSHVTGNKGAREFFIRVSLDLSAREVPRLTESEIDAAISHAVGAALRLEPYRKGSGTKSVA